MRGIYCGTAAKNNEDYKKVIKRRINIMTLIGCIGAVTLITAFVAKTYWKTTFPEYIIGLYTGLGVGLMLISTILQLKNRALLNNEEKLKQSRLVNSDERIREISNRAFRAAATIMIILVYIAALIGGFFYPVLVQVLMSLICIFLLAYMIFYRIYDKRM